MTAKEIARAVGRSERSIRRWIEKAADRMSSIADKMSGVSAQRDFTEDETLAIIEAGLGKAAGVYRANIENRAGYRSNAEMERLIENIARKVLVAVVPYMAQAVRRELAHPSGGKSNNALKQIESGLR